jgi:hypothetical protein
MDNAEKYDILINLISPTFFGFHARSIKNQTPCQSLSIISEICCIQVR